MSSVPSILAISWTSDLRRRAFKNVSQSYHLPLRDPKESRYATAYHSPDRAGNFDIDVRPYF